MGLRQSNLSKKLFFLKTVWLWLSILHKLWGKYDHPVYICRPRWPSMIHVYINCGTMMTQFTWSGHGLIVLKKGEALGVLCQDSVHRYGTTAKRDSFLVPPWHGTVPSPLNLHTRVMRPSNTEPPTITFFLVTDWGQGVTIWSAGLITLSELSPNEGENKDWKTSRIY